MSSLAQRLGYLEKSYKTLSPLKTDFYQLTMGQAFFNQKRHEDLSTFYMHWRKPPFGGSYTVAAGLEGVVDYLKHFTFSEEDISYLATLEQEGRPLFTKPYLDYLRNLKLDLTVDAVPEGTVMTGPGPVIRVTGPKIQCQLVESAILNIINASSMVATRAARVDESIAGNGAFVDFSLRRAPSLDLTAPRAAVIGGALGTSDPAAAKELGLKPTGTMAHSFVQSYLRPGLSTSKCEQEAFVAWLKEYPHNSVLLVDTFDPLVGLQNAIWAAQHTGTPLQGIRFDSGDLYTLTWEAEKQLAQARMSHPELFKNTQIYLTNDLDEYKINEFQRRSISEKGQPFPARRFGVGTSLGNPGPLGGVYKISATQAHDGLEDVTYKDAEGHKVNVLRTMKIAGRDEKDEKVPGSKSSLPGMELDTLRLRDAKQMILGDIIIDRALEKSADPMQFDAVKRGKAISLWDNRSELSLPAAASAETLLKPVFRRQKGGVAAYVHDAPPLKEAYPGGPQVTDLMHIQAYCKGQRAGLAEDVRAIDNPVRVPIFLDGKIHKHRMGIMEQMTLADEQTVVANIDVLIDMQNGFARFNLPREKGGCLYVPEGENIGKTAAGLIDKTRDGVIVLSQDFHPEHHISLMENHPGIMDYRRELLRQQGKDESQVLNPLELPFSEIVMRRDGNIIGVKEGSRVRKVEVVTRDGSEPNAKDYGRVAKVLDTYFDQPFHTMKGVRTQMLWPHHCIQGKESAHFLPELPLPKGLRELAEQDITSPTLEFKDKDTGNTWYVVRKGMNPEVDSYGIGLENDKRTKTKAEEVFTQIADRLQDQDVKEVNLNVGGLATNFCVEFSNNNIHDMIVGIFSVRGIKANVNFVHDMSRGIPIPGGKMDPFSLEGASHRMAEKGSRITDTAALIRGRAPSPMAAGPMTAHAKAAEQQTGIA